MVPISKLKLRHLFDQAIEMPVDARAAFLAAQVAGDEPLRLAAQELADAYERAGDFLADPTVPLDRILSFAPSAARVSKIGPYCVVSELGRGGFGTVYLARRCEPADAEPALPVAIKIVNVGMEPKQVLARFQVEREALARMNHPNIARLIDEGVSEDGRPWIAAEFVDGMPITDFCRSNNLPLIDRLTLFAELCDALQHAHQNLFIHRDVKPSNVLVTFAGGRPVAKVIDFGIAKAIESPSASEPGMTQAFGPSGTPQYMSPEQLGDPTRAVDTRTDVYGLGLILYEMLTDTPAFNLALFRHGGEPAMRRIILALDPPLPSRRVDEVAASHAGPASSEAATQAKRRSDAIRGELDWIVGKAIEKDRERRYATADALAQDIRKYLHGESVSAGPPGVLRQIRKLIAQNPGLSGTVAAIAAAVILGLIGTSFGFHRASVERDRALLAQQNEMQQRRIADEQRASAQSNEREAKKQAERVLGAQMFLYRLFAPDVDGSSPGALTPTLLKYVSARTGDGSLGRRPEVEAPVRFALGNAFLHLNSFKDAESEFARAVEVFRSLEPGGGSNTASALNNEALARLSDHRSDGAEALLRESIAIYRHVLKKDAIEDAPALQLLGAVLANEGRSAEAIEPMQEATTILQQAYGADDPRSVDSLRTVANVAEKAGELKLAASLRVDLARFEQQSARRPGKPPLQTAPADHPARQP